MSVSVVGLRNAAAPPMAPKPPPRIAAPIAACLNSSLASSLVSDSPACHRSRACWAISCGTSNATPRPTPFTILPVLVALPLRKASTRTSAALSDDSPLVSNRWTSGNLLNPLSISAPGTTSNPACAADAAAALPKSNSSTGIPASAACCCTSACLCKF